jgi:hypothetical protein
VDNCEVSQFQRGGIALFRDSERAHIHHNFLHDIATYPVLLGNGTGDGHVIEANRIEWAWHAIASNASRGSGYTARYNVFLRVPRPKLFDQSGPDPPNWCLDTHANNGAEIKPPRPTTRKLVAHHNTFLAHPDVKVGDGSDLLKTVGIYPKHDLYIGAGESMTNDGGDSSQPLPHARNQQLAGQEQTVWPRHPPRGIEKQSRAARRPAADERCVAGEHRPQQIRRAELIVTDALRERVRLKRILTPKRPPNRPKP